MAAGMRDEPASRRKRTTRRALRWSVVPAVIVVLAGLEFFLERWDISAICPKCLQHAYIRERRILGLVVYRRTRLSQAHGGLMSSATFSPRIPAGGAGIYEQIHGVKCRHEFKAGGFGRTTGVFLFRLHGDGSSFEWSMFTPRIRATEALYVAFGQTGDREAAVRGYTMIEGAYPLDERSRAVAVWCGTRSFRDPAAGEAEIEAEIKELEQYDKKVSASHPEYISGPAARRLLALRRLRVRLKEITASEEFNALLDEYSEQLGPEAAAAKPR